jgi:hypothetical protein
MSALKRFLTTLPRDPLRAVIVAFLVGTVLFQLLIPVSATVARAAMARFHLRSSSVVLWQLMQIVPSMYNFENRIWITEAPLDDEALAEPPSTTGFYINHYPARTLTYGYQRRWLGGLKKPLYVTLRSRYQGHDLVTRFKLTISREGDANHVRVDAIGKHP